MWLTILIVTCIIAVLAAKSIGSRKNAEDVVTGKCPHSFYENNTCRNCGKIYEDDKD